MNKFQLSLVVTLMAMTLMVSLSSGQNYRFADRPNRLYNNVQDRSKPYSVQDRSKPYSVQDRSKPYSVDNYFRSFGGDRAFEQFYERSPRNTWTQWSDYNTYPARRKFRTFETKSYPTEKIYNTYPAGSSYNQTKNEYENWDAFRRNAGCGLNKCRGVCGRKCKRKPCKPGQSCEYTEYRCIDGGWGPWSKWGECKQSCGDEWVQRFRTCDNPPKTPCGKDCTGWYYEKKNVVCGRNSGEPYWAGWQAWSKCKATCGPETRHRLRDCVNNDCDIGCEGNDFEMEDCGNPPCCIHGGWGEWTTWSACSQTCGASTIKRSRECNSPSPNKCGTKCQGRGTDTSTRFCGPNYTKGRWYNWESWSTCSRTCGFAERERSRQCNSYSGCSTGCDGPKLDVEKCNVPACSLDGGWSSWGSWSSCSASCGGGRHFRYRSCTNPSPSTYGRPCAGLGRERDWCNTQDCKTECVAGNWAEWMSWGACSTKCGQGTYTRVRTCTNPAPTRGCGWPCVGDPVERGVCNEHTPCDSRCVDGNWAKWGHWGTCSKTCGSGTRERKRDCSSPPRNYCGKECKGPTMNVGMCNLNNPCIREDCEEGTWAIWGAWTSCSATCQGGSKSRTRNCIPSSCGLMCPGMEYEVTDCNEDISCEPCEKKTWGEWNRWGSCSATCDEGVEIRIRECGVVGGRRPCAGSTCKGSDEQKRPCYEVLPDCNVWRSCDPGWTLNPETGGCYRLHEHKVDYATAESECSKKSAYLPQCNSEPENKFMIQIIKNSTIYGQGKRIWLGLKWEGDWKWQSGITLGFTNWHTDQGGVPSNGHCACMDDIGDWWENSCQGGDKHCYVCVKPPPENQGPMCDCNCEEGQLPCALLYRRRSLERWRYAKAAKGDKQETTWE